MQTSTANQSSETDRSIPASTRVPPPRRLFTLPKFAERHGSFITLPALTNQVFKSRSRHSSRGHVPGNGMLDYGVIVRINRRVLIDEDAYFRWLDAQQGERESPSGKGAA
ncbi:MAG: hypothetical protein ACYC9Z_10115 [Casimicrobiaceae bacterium]